MAGNLQPLLFDFDDFIETANAVAPSKPLPAVPFPRHETIQKEPPGIPETVVFPAVETFKPYGAWLDFNRRLTAAERNTINSQAAA